jgi:hypothetical protein
LLTFPTTHDTCGTRPTTGDVASGAGLRLEQAEEAVRALAADSQATLQVSQAGDVVYAFAPGFQEAIASKSLLLRLEPAAAGAQQPPGSVAPLGLPSPNLAPFSSSCKQLNCLASFLGLQHALNQPVRLYYMWRRPEGGGRVSGSRRIRHHPPRLHRHRLHRTHRAPARQQRRRGQRPQTQ